MEEPSVTARIDVHQHMIPEAYRELLAKHGIDAAGGRDLPDWSMGSALGLMDTVGIATTILSVSTPGVSFLKGEAASVAARDLNQFGAELTRQAPERFGFFATLPLPDAHASLEEARFALETLNADGVTMLANSRGVYLGSEHPGSDDLFAYLNQRSAVIPRTCQRIRLRGSRRSPPTSCSTPPGPPIFWSATGSESATRTSASSSVTPAEWCPTSPIAWRSRS